jgi:vacuolar-type H+-ATPase subunit F/Vma7
LSKIFVLGDKESIFPFEAVGAQLLPVSTAEDFRRAWSEIKARKESALVFLTPAAYTLGQREVQAARAEGRNTIIVLPFAKGETEPGLEEMRYQLARAIGADLIGKKKNIKSEV